MSRTFASGDLIEVASNAAFDLASGSVGGWIKTSQAASFIALFGRHSAGSKNGITLFIDSSDVLRVQIYPVSAPTALDISGTTNIRSGAWVHIGLNFSQANGGAGALYVNGVSEASGSNSASWSFAGDVLRLASLVDTFWTPFVGDMAEWFITNTQLSAGQWASLGKGLSPKLVAPGLLVDHWPLIGRTSPEISLRSGRTGTLTGTSAGAHPRVFYPNIPSWRKYAAAAGGGGSVGSASGTGAATGVGASAAKSPGSSSGTGAATGVGKAVASAVGSAGGSGAALAVGRSSSPAVGSAAGTGDATAVGKSAATGAGSAASIGAASAVGASVVASVGAAAGTATVSGIGTSVAGGQGVGSASGLGAAAAVGVSRAEAIGAASGAGSAFAVSASAGQTSSVGASTGQKRNKLRLNREQELQYWRQTFARIAEDDAKAAQEAARKAVEPPAPELPTIVPRVVEALAPDDVTELLGMYGLTHPLMSEPIAEVSPGRTIQQINQDAIIALLLAA